MEYQFCLKGPNLVPSARMEEENTFINGRINPELIADTLREVSGLTNTGGHSIFIGQIRKDQSATGSVTAIEYTSYEEMAEGLIEKISSEVKQKYDITFIRVRHSLGVVHVGELCLFVFTAAAHRNAAIDACTEIVERIKKEAPIWGKEIFDDQSFKWKVNS